MGEQRHQGSWAAHPLADLLPLIHGKEFDALVADIREHGLRQPIILCGDPPRVLDGRNRLRACRAAGVEPRFEVFEGTEDEALAYVLSLNVARRHLTTPQRAVLALKLLPIEAERARLRMEAGVPPVDPTQDPAEGPAGSLAMNGEATDLAGKRVGVSKETVRQAARLAEHAPDVIDAMTEGVIRSMPEAQRLAGLPDDARPAVVEHLREHGGKVYAAVRAVRADEQEERAEQPPAPVVVEEPGVRLLYGLHVTDALRQLDQGSVHCVVTSPPYWGGLRDYGVPPVEWDGGWTGHLGAEPTVKMYVEHLVAVFDELRRVLRRDGTAWLVLGDTYLTPQQAHGTLKAKDLALVPHRVALALQAAGWWVRQDIVFAKANPMPEPVQDRPTRAHEFVLMLGHPDGDGTYFYDGDAIREPYADPRPKDDKRGRRRGVGGRQDFHTRPHGIDPRPHAGRNRRSVWTLPTQPGPGIHLAVMPEALVEPMVLAGTSEVGACAACGGPWTRGKGADDWQPTCDCNGAEIVPCVVLDPFSGSGTTGKVAREHGRSYIGIDLNADYLALAKKRIGLGGDK